jgi:hypothetical protein
MKRTIAPPGAIVRRSALNKAADTEEANDRTSLGDRSLTRRRPWTNLRPHTHTHTHTQLPRGRTIAQHCAIVRTRDTQLHVTYLGHGYHNPSFSQLSRTQLSRRPPSEKPQITTNHLKSPQITTKSSPTALTGPIPPYPATTFILLTPSSIFPFFHNH